MTTFYFSIITRKGYYRVIPVVSHGLNNAITEFGNMPYSGSNIVTITF